MEENKELQGLNTNIKKPKTDKLNYGFKVLSNGLKVLLIYDPDTNKSAAALGVNIGSLVDKKDEQGLAHFCEHLLTMGNKKYPAENEYGEYLAKNGGFNNAHTLQDKTMGVFAPPTSWIKAYDFSKDAVLVGLSDKEYKDCRYINDYNQYQDEVQKGKRR